MLFSNVAPGPEADAIIVRDYPWGVCLLGEYSKVLHASLAVVSGERLMITAYCAGPVLRTTGVL